MNEKPKEIFRHLILALIFLGQWSGRLMARKKATKRKCKSRIPGVSVGQVVCTSLGPKRKVCFRIGGKTLQAPDFPGHSTG